MKNLGCMFYKEGKCFNEHAEVTECSDPCSGCKFYKQGKFRKKINSIGWVVDDNKVVFTFVVGKKLPSWLKEDKFRKVYLTIQDI